MPEANWRPSFRLKERRRRGEELRSSSPLTYWPWRAWSTECEARSKKTKGQKKKKPASQLYFVSEIVLLSNRIRESILVWHRTLWHNGQFELQTSDLFNTKLWSSVHGNNRLFQQWNWISTSPKKVFVLFFILAYRIHCVGKSLMYALLALLWLFARDLNNVYKNLPKTCTKILLQKKTCVLN